MSSNAKPTFTWLTFGLALVGACKGATVEAPPDNPTPDGLALESVAPIAEDAKFWAPLDATPSPDGARVYFTAATPDGSAVLATSGAGQSPDVLYVGDALAAPFGVVTSLDGATLFISDTGGERDATEPGPVGAILRLSSSGGTPEVVAGTEGTAPRSLHIAKRDGQEILLFTGLDPEDGVPAVFSTGTAGEALTVVFKGEPLAQPSGITMGPDGAIYVADSDAGDDGAAALLVIRDGVAERLVERLRLGYPAGLAMDVAGTTLLASGLHDETDTSVVHAIDLATRERQMLSDGIAQNTESGGVHRAHDLNVFAWAGVAGSEKVPGGTVYLLRGSP
jgi:sugar lactone lactonase YvrE